jgi:hypothetical protein
MTNGETSPDLETFSLQSKSHDLHAPDFADHETFAL